MRIYSGRFLLAIGQRLGRGLVAAGDPPGGETYTHAEQPTDDQQQCELGAVMFQPGVKVQVIERGVNIGST